MGPLFPVGLNRRGGAMLGMLLCLLIIPVIAFSGKVGSPPAEPKLPAEPAQIADDTAWIVVETGSNPNYSENGHRGDYVVVEPLPGHDLVYKLPPGIYRIDGIETDEFGNRTALLTPSDPSTLGANEIRITEDVLVREARHQRVFVVGSDMLSFEDVKLQLVHKPYATLETHAIGSSTCLDQN